MTVIHVEAVEAAKARAALVAGLQGLAAWVATHEDSPLPAVRATFPIPAGDRGKRIVQLEEIADLLGVEVADDGLGGLLAERRFGPVPAGAGLAYGDSSTTGWLARAAAARKAVAA